MSFFVIGLLCMSRKTPLSRIKKIFISRNFTNFTQSRFFRTKTSFVRAFLRCPRKIPIFTSQKPFFCRKLYELSAKFSHFYKPKAFLLHKSFLNCHPKQLFSTLRLPFAPSHNLLSAKNTAVLLISALTPYAVKPERRTDSNHCRRYPETCSFQHSRLPDERRSLSQKHRIDRRFESWVAGLRPACFLVTFCTTQKVTIRSPLQKVPRFCKHRISAQNNKFVQTN